MRRQRSANVAALEAAYPHIRWRQPLLVNGRFFACRVCVGLNGLRGNEVEILPKSRDAWEEHFRAEHGVPTPSPRARA